MVILNIYTNFHLKILYSEARHPQWPFFVSDVAGMSICQDSSTPLSLSLSLLLINTFIATMHLLLHIYIQLSFSFSSPRSQLPLLLGSSSQLPSLFSSRVDQSQHFPFILPWPLLRYLSTDSTDSFCFLSLRFLLKIYFQRNFHQKFLFYLLMIQVFFRVSFHYFLNNPVLVCKILIWVQMNEWIRSRIHHFVITQFQNMQNWSAWHSMNGSIL